MVLQVVSYWWTEEESGQMEVGGMEKEGVFLVAGLQSFFIIVVMDLSVGT